METHEVFLPPAPLIPGGALEAINSIQMLEAVAMAIKRQVSWSGLCGQEHTGQEFPSAARRVAAALD